MNDKPEKRYIAKDLVSKISPETVNNVIQTVLNVASHSVEMKKNRREFEQQFREIQANNKKDNDIINAWIKLIIEAKLNDEQKAQLIDDIRKIAIV